MSVARNWLPQLPATSRHEFERNYCFFPFVDVTYVEVDVNRSERLLPVETHPKIQTVH